MTAITASRATLPPEVHLVEVGPRDGLQNEAVPISTAAKLQLIALLGAAGLREIEVTSFVSPRWVPQMADHAVLMKGLQRLPGVRYPVLVPNEKGLQGALAAGAKEIAVFVAASETFSMRNTNCSLSDGLARSDRVIRAARAEGLRVRGYVSCVLGCPYEGHVSPQRVVEVAQALLESGCDDLSLGDTIGHGTPGTTWRLWDAVLPRIPAPKLAGHFHDTAGMALANILASLQVGIATFDCSVAGLGGCPYAPGARGNVATEDVVAMLDGLGIVSGVDPVRLDQAATFISATLQRPGGARSAALRGPRAARADRSAS